jgi:hypothetical protein
MLAVPGKLSMQTHDWLEKKRHAQDRKILLWAHAVMGGATLALYLYHITLPVSGTLMPGAGLSETLIAAPVLLPYVVSAVYSWRLYSAPYVIHNRVRLALFIVVLTVGGVLMGYLFVAPPTEFERTDLIPALSVQGLAYVWGAERLLNVLKN